MEVIDEKGRLFGVINVIDALVVLLVIATVTAGTTLVLGGQGTPTDSEPEPTRYATVSYTVPLESEAATLAANDTLSGINGDESYNVTDAYRSFTPDGSVHVVARTKYQGKFTANGKQLYGGQSTDLTTGLYRVNSDIVSVNQSEATIPTRRVPAVLSVNASTSVSQAIEEGQQATIGDQTVATVESVRREATNSSKQQVWVGVELQAWDRSTGPVFDGQALRVDNRVTIITDTVVIRGRLHEVGTTTLPETTQSES